MKNSLPYMSSERRQFSASTYSRGWRVDGISLNAFSAVLTALYPACQPSPELRRRVGSLLMRAKNKEQRTRIYTGEIFSSIGLTRSIQVPRSSAFKRAKSLLLAPCSLFLFLSLSLNGWGQTTVYSCDFNSSGGGWTVGGEQSGATWARGTSFSGNASNHMYITPHNDYGSNDAAHITSPTINLSSCTSMTLKVDIRYKTETGFDGMNVYYSTNGGTSFSLLGSTSEGTNWYNNAGVDGINDRYDEVASDPNGWSGDNGSWQTAQINLPTALNGESNVKFRVYFGADGSTVDDGVAFDNFIITTSNTAPAAFTISGPTAPCVGTSQTYTASAGSGTESWTFPSDWTVTSGSSSMTCTVTVGPSSGTVSCSRSNCAGTTNATSGISVSPTTGGQTTYYSKSSGNLNDVANWGANSDGTGCRPTNFTTNGVTYIIQNNATPTTSGTWTVSGTGSIVKVGNGSSGITFTAGGNLTFNCNLEITANATLSMGSNNLTLSGDFIRSASSAGFSQTAGSASTVEFSGSSQEVNVTTLNGTTPTDSDITFNHVTVSGSDVKFFYFKTNDRKLNINNLTVNSSAVLTLYSNPQ